MTEKRTPNNVPYSYMLVFLAGMTSWRQSVSENVRAAQGGRAVCVMRGT